MTGPELFDAAFALLIPELRDWATRNRDTLTKALSQLLESDPSYSNPHKAVMFMALARVGLLG